MNPPFLPIAATILLLGGCANYPRDPEGTLEQIKTERLIRVGLLAGVADGAMRSEVDRYIARLSRSTGARPAAVTGPAELLLAQLEAGELDLVVGPIGKKSPWTAEVAVIEPLAVGIGAGQAFTLSPMARNGENRWIMLLEREVRDMKAGK
jgi:hypothetical protein